MGDFAIPTNQREFRCEHCDGKILIPKDLPPTTGPCPHCGGTITSPEPEIPAMPPAPAQPPPPPPRPAPVPTVVPAVMPANPPPPVEPVRVDEHQRLELPAKAGVSELNRPKKHAADKPAGPKSTLIPALLVLLALILIGGAIFYFASRELGKNVESPASRNSAMDPQAREANYLRSGWQKDAYEVLEGYMAATTVEGKLPFVLRADELEGRMEDFYGGGTIRDHDTPAAGFSVYELSEEDRRRGLFMMVYDQPPQFELREFFRPLASLEVQYGVDEADLLLSTLSRVENFAMDPLRVWAFFKRTESGLKLDWEVFAQTKYRTFLNFVELPEPGATAVFRVFVVEDVPAKGRGDAGTRTYRLTDPANVTDTARVEVKVDSDAGRELSVINWRGTEVDRPVTRTATVELKWSGDPAAPVLGISRFICWEFLGLGGEAPASAE